MDVDVEDKGLLQAPCYNSLGLLAFIEWFGSLAWPVRPYQVAICFSLAYASDAYFKVPYLEEVKERLTYLNEWWIPSSLGERFARRVELLEFGLLYLALFTWIRRGFLRWVLSYTRWIYYSDPSQDISFWGKCWRYGLWLGAGSSPSTFDTETILPSLPLPSVDLTIKRVMGSLAPYLGTDSARYQEIEVGIKKWAKEQGSGCQRRLRVKKWFSGNYATAWWESYTFLCHRESDFTSPTFYAFQKSSSQFTQNSLARAAVLLYLYGNLRTLLKAGKVKTQTFQGRVPMCMTQWRRLFSTTRIANEDHDELWTYPPSFSKHIVVVHNEHYYKVPLFTKWRRIVSPDLLQKMLHFIVEDSSKKSECEQQPQYSPALLTALNRDEWHECRSDFLTSGANKVHLATDSAQSVDSFRGKLWLDKCINFVVLKEATVGIHVNWACMDPAVFGTVLERLRVAETASMYDSETGDAVAIHDADHSCDEPIALNWQCVDEMTEIYAGAQKVCLRTVNAVNSCVLYFTEYGRATVKFKWDLSTDGFIQTALHTAFYRMSRKLALCAEIVPCRLFSNGRNETLRSLTTEVANFVRAFNKYMSAKVKNGGGTTDPSEVDKCVTLLRTACQRHQCLLRHALTGKGVDRHLLALKIAHQFRTSVRCEELDRVIQMPFDLVTCRIPNSSSEGAWQIGLPAPVHKGGLSITYACRSDPEAMDFIVSGAGSRASKFVQTLNQTLRDLQDLLQIHPITF
ncbi:unnamed protein product [Mesocestoides corti]|uniref:Choline/carnitine acyltransferase domain-containing protein n=1 Tax=Mesocestoides corti TaxID=53468 RepID=A0A0R3U3K6_MESCO|nr:unnamed protein product [Mesocestoides corti]